MALQAHNVETHSTRETSFASSAIVVRRISRLMWTPQLLAGVLLALRYFQGGGIDDEITAFEQPRLLS